MFKHSKVYRAIWCSVAILCCLQSATRAEPGDALAIDVQAPTIVHAVPSLARADTSIILQATVTDNVGVARVTVFYRWQNRGDYLALPMHAENSETYRAEIKASAADASALGYYIEVMDASGNTIRRGTATTPFTVQVQDAVASVPVTGVDVHSPEIPASPPKPTYTAWIIGALVVGTLAAVAGGGGGGGGGDATGPPSTTPPPSTVSTTIVNAPVPR